MDMSRLLQGKTSSGSAITLAALRVNTSAPTCFLLPEITNTMSLARTPMISSLFRDPTSALTSMSHTSTGGARNQSFEIDPMLKEKAINKKRKAPQQKLRMETPAQKARRISEMKTISPLLEKFLKRKAIKTKRKGKWTPEEEVYTMETIKAFMDGILDLERGITLRAYLAVCLDCEPMRVTKKLSSQEINGQKVEKKIGKSTYNRRQDVSKCPATEKKLNLLEKLKGEFWAQVGVAPPEISRKTFATELHSPTRTMKKSIDSPKKIVQEKYMKHKEYSSHEIKAANLLVSLSNPAKHVH